MDITAIEGFAALALREARMDGDDRPSARLLCKRLGIGIVSSPMGGLLVGRNSGQVGVVDGRPIIRIRRGLPPWLEQHVLNHEASHVLLARWGVKRMDEEEICNGMAGAISVPRGALLRAWRRGGDLRDVIEAWPHVGPTACALRVGEARLADTLVTVGRKVIFVRAERAVEPQVIEIAAEASHGTVVARDIARGYPLADGKRRAAAVIELAA